MFTSRVVRGEVRFSISGLEVEALEFEIWICVLWFRSEGCRLSSLPTE